MLRNLTVATILCLKSTLKLPVVQGYGRRMFQRTIQTTVKLNQTDGEKRIKKLLSASHLDPSVVEVRDISGGCGSMYEIYVESKEFHGKRMVQQHKLVNEILKHEVKLMHGLRIHTKAAGAS